MFSSAASAYAFVCKEARVWDAPGGDGYVEAASDFAAASLRLRGSGHRVKVDETSATRDGGRLGETNASQGLITQHHPASPALDASIAANQLIADLTAGPTTAALAHAALAAFHKSTAAQPLLSLAVRSCAV